MAVSLRILIHSSNWLDPGDLEPMLREAGYAPEFESVSDIAGLTKALETSGADVVVSEFETSAENGAKNMVEAMLAHAPETPIILTGRKHTESAALKAIMAGAHDFVPYGDRSRLIPALVRAARLAVKLRKAESNHNSNKFKTYFRKLFENSPEAIAILDSNQKIVEVNRAFGELFGYETEEVRGKGVSEVIVPEFMQEEYSSFLTQVYGGNMVRRETIRQRKDGSSVQVSVIGCPIIFEDRKFGVFAIYSDITRQMKAIQALRQAESNYRNFFLNSLEGMYVASPSGRYVLVNPAMAELLGYESPSELTDTVRNIAKEIYTDPETRTRMLARIEREDQVKSYHSLVRRKDGGELEVCENIRAVRDDDGELLYYQGTMHNLTEPSAPKC